jgi:hypothetical protein
VKKLAALFVFVSGIMLLTGKLVYQLTPHQQQLLTHTKQLQYSETEHSQSPVELKQVLLVSPSAVSAVNTDRLHSAFHNHFSGRVIYKHQRNRYPLFIKDQIWRPVFLRNNCLRI